MDASRCRTPPRTSAYRARASRAIAFCARRGALVALEILLRAFDAMTFSFPCRSRHTALMSGLRLPGHQEKETAGHDRTDAGPDRNIDRLLVLHRQLERADRGLVGLLRVAELAVCQS